MFPHHSTCHHSVVFYKDDASVRDSLTTYVTAALRAGDPALVIAKPGLLHEVTLEVHRQHMATPFGPQRADLVTLDAAGTLAKFCIDGKPDHALFDEVLGDALEGLCASGKRVAAYGEMVGILCERGQYADAVVLEAMWNELLARHRASLFCGYPSDLFTSAESRPFYHSIRAAHTVVHAAG